MRHLQHVLRKVMKKGVQQHAVGAGCEISKRKIYEEYSTGAMLVFARDQAVRRLQQGLAEVFTGRLEAWIFQFSIQVSHQNLTISRRALSKVHGYAL